MKKGVEYPYFLRCSTVDKLNASEKKCKKCRRMKPGVNSAMPTPMKETMGRFLGGPHGWTVKNLISRKKTEGGGKEKLKIELVQGSLVHEPAFQRQMFAPPTPKDYVAQQVIVQPVTINGVGAHPLRVNLVELPLSGKEIQRKPVAVATEGTKQNLKPNLSKHAQFRNSAASSQNAELAFDDGLTTAKAATQAAISAKHILSHQPSIHSQNRGSAAPTQKAELFLDYHPSSAKAALKVGEDVQQILNIQSKRPRKSHGTQPRPVALTELIPELQAYTPYRPPINMEKLAGYLTEVATRPRHKPLSAEDYEFLTRETQRYTAVRHATAASLQKVEIVPTADRASQPAFAREAEGLPGCLVPGRRTQIPQIRRKEPSQQPQALERKKAFSAVTFAEVPLHFDFHREAKLEQGTEEKIVAGNILKEAETSQITETCPAVPLVPQQDTARPQTAAPEPLSPNPLQKVRTAPSRTSQPPSTQHLPNRANSHARPGWEVYSADSPLSPAPLQIRKKKSPLIALNTATQPIESLQPHRLAPRIPSLQKIGPLKFDGTLLEGSEGRAEQKMPRKAKKGRRYGGEVWGL